MIKALQLLDEKIVLPYTVNTIFLKGKATTLITSRQLAEPVGVSQSTTSQALIRGVKENAYH